MALTMSSLERKQMVSFTGLHCTFYSEGRQISETDIVITHEAPPADHEFSETRITR